LFAYNNIDRFDSRYLSRYYSFGFRPVEILKGKLKLGNNSGLLRKSLIAGQFVTSIGMIICTIVISGTTELFAE
jgi:hypothetical protein